MLLLKLNPIEPPWYGPVCPVVWEGRRREVSPYPDHRQYPDDALIDPDEDEPAIDVGDCPRGVLHGVLGWDERHIPQHQLGNPHSPDLSMAP